MTELLDRSLPEFETRLRGLQKSFDLPQPPAPTSADRSSSAALRAWFINVQGTPLPEAELRQRYETAGDGSIGKTTYTPGVGAAIQQNRNLTSASLYLRSMQARIRSRPGQSKIRLHVQV